MFSSLSGSGRSSGLTLGNYSTLYRLSDRTEIVVGTINPLSDKNFIVIDGKKTTIATGAYSIRTLNTIDANGNDSGTFPLANTLYYVYHSNSNDTNLPETVRLCATQNDSTGRLPLNHNWRLLGCVFISYQYGTLLHSYTSTTSVNSNITGTKTSNNYVSSSTSTNSFILFPDPQSNGQTDLPLTLLPNQQCRITVQQKHYVTGVKQFGIKISLDGVDLNLITSSSVWNATPNMFVEAYYKNNTSLPVNPIFQMYYYYTSGSITIYADSHWHVERFF